MKIDGIFTNYRHRDKKTGDGKFTNFLNENIPDYIKKNNWSLNSCGLNILDYVVWDMMKKMVYRNVK